MSRYRIAVIEDEPIIASEIEMHLRMLGYDVSGVYHSAGEASLGLQSSPPDLALADVHLGNEETDGIDLIERLKPAYPVVFLTSYGDEHTIQRARQTNPAGYIIKPFDERDLRSAVSIALHNAIRKADVNDGPEDIFVKDRDQLVRITCRDILWIEACDNYTYIKTTGQKYLICSTLKKVGEKLRQPCFCRIHRSYIINMDGISSISESHVVINSFKLPIGKTYRGPFMQKLALI
ncbi:LytR/AlgR family response regulator transcription factor [Roseivirga sp. BDSF3-8]|uniref:LytR/AlgR family response regulator transcription factor n=1 Tax=Roseivirga sp. BDSF3-8 TaxID=3241598 RepID=UPI003532790F